MSDKNLFKKTTGAYYPIIIMFLFILLGLSLSRIFLIIYDYERIETLANLVRILINGIRVDIVMACYISALPVVLTPILEGNRFTHKVWSNIMIFWFSFWLITMVIMESSTPAFIDQYDVRPNRLFVEYLIYPKEVFGMLAKGYALEIVLGVILTIFVGYISFMGGKKLFLKPSKTSFLFKILTFPIIAFLVFAGARSSIGHRPLSPANVAFSTDSLLNDLGLNSLYSFLYAVYRMKDEGDVSKLYGKMDKAKMLDIVCKSLKVNKDAYLENSLKRFNKASNETGKKLNIVIILEESMGAEFVGSLGGDNLTPQLDELSKEGLWFEKLYATGTRSVRGIEAIISGFPPTPGRSVVKLGKSQNNFFTLPDLLTNHGYSTSFIYGGDSNFDNMRKFFLGNGFQKIIDEKDYENPKFKSTWGVSDEDLFNKADEFFTERSGSPFFSLIFTSSNHSPFELPKMEEGLYPDQGNTVNNAVKYADYALGKFFEKAKKSNYWNNTIFLVVADHNSRVYGNQIIPVERFRIPGLIIGPGIDPKIKKDIASQIDIGPTLLSLAGISDSTPMPGRDLTKVKDGVKGRAIMQFYKNQGYLVGDELLVMQPDKAPEQYRYIDNTLKKSKIDKDLFETALAGANWAYWVYDKQLYRK